MNTRSPPPAEPVSSDNTPASSADVVAANTDSLSPYSAIVDDVSWKVLVRATEAENTKSV